MAPRGLILWLALVATLLWSAEVAYADTLNATAYHGILFERKYTNVPIIRRGSAGALIRSNVVPYHTTEHVSTYANVAVFVASNEHLTGATVSGLLNAGATALVVALSDTDRINEEVLSLFLTTTDAVDQPIYFVDEQSPDGQLIEQTLKDSHTPHYLKAATSLQKPPVTMMPDWPSAVVSSHLRWGERRDQRPSIRLLISAHFDTFGVAPAAPTVSGASGTVAAVEVWRRLVQSTEAQRSSKAYAPFAATLRLGSTARMNYQSSSRWLSQTTDKERGAMDLAICLEELMPLPSASSQLLYLHVNDRFLRQKDGQVAVELAESTAAAMGMELKVIAAKTDYQHHDLQFEHEVFADRQLPAMTFSSHRSHRVDQIVRDVRQPLSKASMNLLHKRVDFIHAFVTAFLKQTMTDASVWEGTEGYVRGLMEYAARQPRSPAARGGESLLQFAQSLQRLLNDMESTTHLASGPISSLSSGLRVDQIHMMPSLSLYSPFEMSLIISATLPMTNYMGLLFAAIVAVAVFTFSELQSLHAVRSLFL